MASYSQARSSGKRLFVNDPDLTNPHAEAWQTQVIIPSSPPDNHAFLRPLPESQQGDEKTHEIFPGCPNHEPRIFIKGPHVLDFMNAPSAIFKSMPPVIHQTYVNWLNKIKAKKGKTWKTSGIFDLIQLSRYGPEYHSPILIAALHFWESSTNSLHLKCGMLTPTLLDVAAITGLKPTGDIFDPTVAENRYGFNFRHTSFKGFMEDHYVTDIGEVSDREHVVFLTFWLSSFVFCSSSTCITREYHNLAIQLHELRNICLSQLILGSLYEALGLVPLN